VARRTGSRPDDLLTALAFDEAPTFLRAGDRRFSTAPAFGHVFRRAAKPAEGDRPGPGLVGVYTLRSATATASTPPIPVLYVCKCDSVETADKVHRLVWNQDVVPFVLVATPEDYRLYSGFDYNVRSAKRSANLLRAFNSAAEVAEAGFHADAIDDGRVWREWGARVRPEGRVDWTLLDNLKTLAARLQDNGLPIELAHALIGKYVFLHYLRDRDILSQRKLDAWTIKRESVFGRDASLSGLRAVVKRLDDWLNGSVFPLRLSGKGAPDTEHVRMVALTFAGDEPKSGGSWQLHLDFQAYDFSYIPIETLSVVYEQFLHAPSSDKRSRGREAGAYYTPIPVVNFMLAELEDRHPLTDKTRILDPACGSGAFLVQCYRRLIEKALTMRKGELRPIELRSLLTRSIFGIDRDPEACSVTELSLILTLLDYCDPPDLENGSRFKLPTLRSSNVLAENFFSTDPDPFANLGGRGFDWVVGNPPWKRLKSDRLSDDDRPAWDWMQRSKKQDMPVGGHQVAQAFAWEVSRYLAEGGHVALLMPAMMLFEDPSQDFRSSFFRRNQVQSVANFANLAEVLFAGRSRVPAAAIFYTPRAEEAGEPSFDEYIAVCSPLVANQEPTRPVQAGTRTESWSLVVNGAEVRGIPARSVLKGNGLPWKLATWGSHLDARLLERVSQRFLTLRDAMRLDLLVYAEGSQLRAAAGGEVERCEEVAGKQTINVKALEGLRHLFAFPIQALLSNKKNYLRLRGGKLGLDVCRPPHVIVSAARNFAIYSEEYLIVPPRQIGVISPSGDKRLLKAFAVYMNSDFAYYHQFLRSTELGVKRDRATLSAFKTIPLPMISFDAQSLDRWAGLHDRLVAASKAALAMPNRRGPDLFTQQSDDTGSESIAALLVQANEAVSDALGLKPRERAIVNDLVNVRLELNDGKLGANAVGPPTADHLRAYADRLQTELDTFVGDALPKRHNVEVLNDRNTGMIHVELVPAGKARPVAVLAADSKTAVQLERTRARLRQQRAQWVYFDRNLQIFEGTSTYTFKPMQRFHWTESQAMCDAAEIIAKTLSSSGGRSR